MFNVFFPKLLELSQEGKGEVAVKTEASSLESNIVDVVIYALGGCPGALVCSSQLFVEHGQNSLLPVLLHVLDRGMDGELLPRPALVSRGEHLRHCALLCGVYYG